jgi:tellurite resistance protein TerC
MSPNFLKWTVFNLVVLALLLFDLGVLRRKSHDVKLKEALGWSAFWISLALLFFGGVWFYDGRKRAFEFLTGYITEYALSVDNIFVFILIFSYFKVAPAYRHKVLFWGIMGALIMRGVMILLGVELVHRFEWILYVFGAFLVFTGIRLAFKSEDVDPSANPMVKLARKFLPVTEQYHGDHFFTMQDGKRFATPLFIVLLVIETSDLIFAVDSIPAIIGISKDSFIIYTSNVFAILGLRSLYFALAGIMDLFHYLKYALSFILTFVGIKMLIEKIYHIPIEMSLGIIIAALVISIIASLRWPLPDEKTPIDEAQDFYEGKFDETDADANSTNP